MAGTKKSKKRMRLPNGIGSVHQINDGKRRRKPWRARVPSHVEFNEETGRATQKYITLGYYETETEAIEALFDYRKNPYTLEAAVCTFADVYDMWKAKKFPSVSKSAQRGYGTAYNNSEPLHGVKMRDIRSTHMEQIIASTHVGYEAQHKMLSLWNQLFKYAMEHDIAQKNYSTFVSAKDKVPETKRTAIAKEDMETLWKEVDKGNEAAEIVMIYAYTGFRASEILEIKKENIDIKKRIMVGGLKTDAGKDRRVPIHKAILPLIEKRMKQDNDYLLSRMAKGKIRKFTYRALTEEYWNPLMQELGMDYTVHYARHTLATMMREADIEEDIRKLILGHKNGDITSRYTHITDDMLVEAIDKLPSR